MGLYRYLIPAGWRQLPLPPPQQGIQLRAPIPPNRPDSAAILLLDALVPAGSVADQLAALVRDGCADGEVVERLPPVPVRTLAFRGLAQAVGLTAPAPAPHPEVRLFALVDAGYERLPVVLIGGAGALAVHKPALDYLLASIAPSDGEGRAALGFWTD